MNMLFIAMFPPYDRVSHAGGQTVNFYVKKFLKYADVRIITFDADKEEIISDAERNKIDLYSIPLFSNSVLTKIADYNSKRNPFHKYGNMTLRSRVKSIVKQLNALKLSGYIPDVIILEWTQIVLTVKDIKKVYNNVPIVASESDVAFLGYQRRAKYEKNLFKKIYRKLRAVNLRKRELTALKRCDLTVVQNLKDKNLLIDNGFNKAKIHVIAPFYHRSLLQRDRNSNDIVFYGAMDRLENTTAVIWFVKNVMPLINDLPCRFVIIGSKPTQEIIDLTSERVIVTGYVPSVDEFFSRSLCFVAPLLLGAGIKVKVLEALYSGIPVLTNEIGIEGIPAETGKEFFLCKSAEDYEKNIRKIFNGDVNAENIGIEIINKNFVLDDSFDKYYEKIKCLID